MNTFFVNKINNKAILSVISGMALLSLEANARSEMPHSVAIDGTSVHWGAGKWVDGLAERGIAIEECANRYGAVDLRVKNWIAVTSNGDADLKAALENSLGVFALTNYVSDAQYGVPVFSKNNQAQWVRKGFPYRFKEWNPGGHRRSNRGQRTVNECRFQVVANRSPQLSDGIKFKFEQTSHLPPQIGSFEICEKMHEQFLQKPEVISAKVVKYSNSWRSFGAIDVCRVDVVTLKLK